MKYISDWDAVQRRTIEYWLYADLNYIQDKDPGKQERVRVLEKRFPDDLIGFIWCWIDQWDRREFGGSICFNGGVDVQGTMIHGSPAAVRAEFRHLNDIFGRFGGGYIANTSHSIMPETPLDNVIALFEAYL